ncbi:peptidylprolyl isomerase [Oceanicaulis sp. AH-315-P02]|nr:peptidylprolyl isomerase [Robiginitomaculum sp.]MBN4047870.1 peptidylprolyl isomerase [Oceanicaulis sp. AH-315-P02]
MIYRIILPFIIALLAIVVLSVQARGQVSEGVTAIVNDQVISSFDVRQRMRMMVLSTQTQPTEESLRRFQNQAMRSLVDERLKLQEAGKFDIEVSQREIDQQISRLARQNSADAESIKADLLRANISASTLEEQIRSDIAWQILINGKYGSRVRVSNNQIELEQQRFKNNLAKPQYLVSEILLESPSLEQDSAIYAGGVSLIQQMREGAPFPAVAQQFSSAPSGPQGGDMGWIRQGDMPAAVDTALATMQIGTVSNPIKVAGGYMIVALRDRKEGGAAMVANFRQMIAPSGSEKQFTKFLEDAKTCKDTDGLSKEIDGAFMNPFTNVALTDLAPAFRQTIESLQNNQWSKPLETPNGLLSIMLCSTDYAEGAGVPTSDEIVNRLTDQKLGMLSRRLLRDLRRDSLIEYRN